MVKVARVMKERASVAGMEDPDVAPAGTPTFALAEVDSTDAPVGLGLVFRA